jgi:hypothetical protein
MADSQSAAGKRQEKKLLNVLGMEVNCTVRELLSATSTDWHEHADVGGDRRCMQGVAVLLRRSVKLTCLRLGGDYRSGLSEGDSMRILACGLKSNTTLTTLDLNSTAMADVGAATLSRALPTMTGLTQLWLADNQIGAQGADSLAQALSSMTGLLHLDLGSNEMGSLGTAALAQRAEARANKAEHEREFVQAALEREKAARAAIGSELAEVREQARASAQTVAKAKETQLAYEGACAEVRRLQTALAAALDGGSEADEAVKQLAVLKTALEERLIALMAENAQLTHQVKHAEHLRSLFQTVTSRTNELQEAANSVIKQVEMSKQTRQGETRPATSSGAGEPLRPANYTLQEIRATAAATFARVPVPPSGPKAPRQGGPDRAALRR